jgi:hypothetical protein
MAELELYEDMISYTVNAHQYSQVSVSPCMQSAYAKKSC